MFLLPRILVAHARFFLRMRGLALHMRVLIGACALLYVVWSRSSQNFRRGDQYKHIVD